MKRWASFFCQILFLCNLLGCHGAGSPMKDEATDSEAPIGPYQSKGLDRSAIRSNAVREAMSRIPRHKFVPKDVQQLAYEDRALPIGEGQTISQPYIVAFMTQEAAVSEGSRVLEIGTGSGYQAAVLAELGATVYTIEIVPELAELARRTLYDLGYEKVHVRSGDGWRGWPEEAPFDAILVTAAAPRPPEELLGQLAHRGRMVVPIEQPDSDGEHLMLIERENDDFITRDLGAVKFVPITGSARTTESPQPSALEELISGKK